MRLPPLTTSGVCLSKEERGIGSLLSQAGYIQSSSKFEGGIQTPTPHTYSLTFLLWPAMTAVTINSFLHCLSTDISFPRSLLQRTNTPDNSHVTGGTITQRSRWTH